VCFGTLLLGIFFSTATAAENPALRATAVWSDGHHSSLTPTELKASVVSGTWPEYPLRARMSKFRGEGVYEIHVDKSGMAIRVVIIKSSGQRILDQAAVDAFMGWRLKPGTFLRIQLPVTWKIGF
jgi:TonB family protein